MRDNDNLSRFVLRLLVCIYFAINFGVFPYIFMNKTFHSWKICIIGRNSFYEMVDRIS